MLVIIYYCYKGGGYSGVIKTEILPRINLENQQFEVKDTIAYRFPPPNRLSLLRQFLNHLQKRKNKNLINL